MLVIFFRAITLFVIIFLVIRLMGKRELSKVQPFELAIIVMISDLASGPMSSRDMSIFGGLIPIIALLIMYIIFTLIIQSSNKVEKVICGSPSLIIFKGKLLEHELKKQQLTIEEVMSQLRSIDIFKIQDVAYALLETNGKITAAKVSDAIGQMPLNIITEGQYLENNLEILNMSKEDCEKLLVSENIKLEDILIGTINELGIFVYQLKEEEK